MKVTITVYFFLVIGYEYIVHLFWTFILHNSCLVERTKSVKKFVNDDEARGLA